MSEAATTKVCPACAEEIKAAAEICPFCRRHQTKLSFWKQPQAHLILLLFPVVVVGAMFWLGSIFGPGRAFTPYQAQIVVVGPKMHFSHTATGDFISTIGFLRNNSPFDWKDLQLEVQYFDSAGNLTDTRTESFAFQRLPASATHAFRIRSQADKPEAAYASQKVFVRAAKDGRRAL